MAKLTQYKVCIFCLLLLICCYVPCRAQNNYTLIIVPVDSSAEAIRNLNLRQGFSSVNDCLKYAEQLPSLLAAKGYISCSIDSLEKDSVSVTASLFLGERYIWNSLHFDEKYWNLLSKLGYNKEPFNKKPFGEGEIAVMHEKILNYYAENGYPFAKINLDSVTLNNGLVSAKINIDKGAAYYIDSIRVYGNLKIKPSFLHGYLTIAPHELYNQEKLNNVNRRLLELPYAQQTQPWNITMLNTGAMLNLYLQQKQSNEINVLVGFLPDNEQSGGKLLFTGEAHLNLKNAFATGETIGLNWQQLQPKSPRLNLAFQKPFVFRSHFGLDFNFELYKRDSLFLNVYAQMGLQYTLSANQTGKILFQTAKTSLLDVDTLMVIVAKRLPEFIDVSSVSIGLEYNFNNTNYRFNPRKGNEVNISGSAGNKTIKKNNAILQIKDPFFSYSNLYDSFPLQSYQFRVRLVAAHYFPLAKQATFKIAVNAGLFQSPSYFNNELFQIGGYRLLRGFNEESIYTNRYAVGTLEYRYLLTQNSYFFGFSDVGKAKYQNNNVSFSHTYLGVGAGLAFETKTGIFNISYAVGKREDAKLDLRQSKIHLGFVSMF